MPLARRLSLAVLGEDIRTVIEEGASAASVEDSPAVALAALLVADGVECVVEAGGDVAVALVLVDVVVVGTGGALGILEGHARYHVRLVRDATCVACRLGPDAR
jgi:hypothetical protein